MSLKVLHLSTYAGGGGAARAAVNVNLALQGAGVDSRMVTAHGSRFKLARAADRALWHLQRSPVETWRSPARFGSLSAKAINNSPADIVNLHWVTDGFLSIEEIGKIRKPVVMSMYDMWPFCGTEHYGVDSPDARWRIGYSPANRPVVETRLDLDRYTWVRKSRNWARLYMVPASDWLTKATQASALCADWPITHIPHAVNGSVFRPMNRQSAKAFFGIRPDRPTVAFVASAGINDMRKGFDLLESSLRQMSADSDRPLILLIGPAPQPDQIPLDLDVHIIGPVQDDLTLARAYNAADVLAVPSREDNMPLTAMEAQMCGRPVVGFAIGGLVDIIDHLQTGYLAFANDVHDFASGLQLVVDDALSESRFGARAQAHASRRWNFSVVAASYLNLYEAALKA